MPVTTAKHSPIFFEPNRAWRCYTGGRLLDKFLGLPSAQDGLFPEEWIVSTTRACNGPDQQHPDEGLSRLRGEQKLLRDLLIERPEIVGKKTNPAGDVGVLCKYLDSAVRLPIQCHPDRAFAREHYHSPYGKAECWFILDTRVIDGEEPYLLLGFKPEADFETFADAAKRQDVPLLESLLHRVPVKPGEAYFLPGRFPHAIGSGVLLLEVQEPSDWVVQPELRLGERELSRETRWGPLTPELALTCFDFSARGSLAEILRRSRLEPKSLAQTPAGRLESLIDPGVTDCFTVKRLTAQSEMSYQPSEPYLVISVVSGAGEVVIGGAAQAVRQGDYFLVPAGAGELRFRPAKGKPLTAYLIAGAGA